MLQLLTHAVCQHDPGGLHSLLAMHAPCAPASHAKSTPATYQACCLCLFCSLLGILDGLLGGLLCCLGCGLGLAFTFALRPPLLLLGTLGSFPVYFIMRLGCSLLRSQL